MQVVQQEKPRFPPLGSALVPASLLEEIDTCVPSAAASLCEVHPFHLVLLPAPNPHENPGQGCACAAQARPFPGQKCRKEKPIKVGLSIRVGHLTLFSCALPSPGAGKMCGKSSSHPASVSWKIFLQQFVYYELV